jgi:signal transduction histidine kinase
VLAGGIAHDFNNLLMVINGYSEELQDTLELAPELRKSAAIINKAGNKAAMLTRQLLGFSRQTFLQKRVIDLNTIVPNVASMMDGVLGADIQLLVKLQSDLQPVSLDPKQMEQVLTNLIINARDGMPEGGTLTIETANVELTEVMMTQQGQADPGSYVSLSVTDTGTGMSPELLQRIFEPFFTTKEVGKGSGLGLSMVLGLIQQSGGYITVSSEPGQGSCFRIYCPVWR